MQQQQPQQVVALGLEVALAVQATMQGDHLPIWALVEAST